MMGSEKAQSTEVVTINGEQYEKNVYADKNLYFNDKGQLAIIEVTKPVYADALEKLQMHIRRLMKSTPSRPRPRISQRLTSRLQTNT